MSQDRCEVFIQAAGDATGEKAELCNAPANYCPRCEAVLCPSCHLDTRCSRSEQAPARNSMRLQFNACDLDPHGLEIGIIGFEDNPANSFNWPSQIYVELYEGKLRVHVWNGQEDPAASIEIEPLQNQSISTAPQQSG